MRRRRSPRGRSAGSSSTHADRSHGSSRTPRSAGLGVDASTCLRAGWGSRSARTSIRFVRDGSPWSRRRARAGGRQQDDDDHGPGNDEEIEGPTITTRFTSFAPQLSFNFGRDEGWSYISGGIGSARITSEKRPSPHRHRRSHRSSTTAAAPAGSTARGWPSRSTSAVYAISPRDATTTVPGYPRAKFMVLSAGWLFGDAGINTRLGWGPRSRHQKNGVKVLPTAADFTPFRPPDWGLEVRVRCPRSSPCDRRT